MQGKKLKIAASYRSCPIHKPILLAHAAKNSAGWTTINEIGVGKREPLQLIYSIIYLTHCNQSSYDNHGGRGPPVLKRFKTGGYVGGCRNIIWKGRTASNFPV